MSKRSDVSRLRYLLPTATSASNKKGAIDGLPASASSSEVTGIPTCANARRSDEAATPGLRNRTAISL